MNRAIDPLTAYRMMQQDTSCVVLDVRTAAEYSSLHVPGSTHIPLDQLNPARMQAEHIEGVPLLLICHSGTRAARAAELLSQSIPSASIVEGGIAAWQSAGLPVVRGARHVLPLMQQVQIAAGLLVVLGCLLVLVHPVFLAVPLLVGIGLTLAGITGACPMARLLSRLPWNRQTSTAPTCNLPLEN